jgi:hypothetical protein
MQQRSVSRSVCYVCARSSKLNHHPADLHLALPSNCGNGPQGFTFQYGGPDYGITAWIPCGNCGMTQVNIYSSPECMPIGFGLNRQAIQSLLASANGRQVLMPACGGGFRPLLEPPLAVAQERWEFPKHRQIILR